jgi:hypothetical protein
VFGRGFNANSEYTAWIRKILDEASVPWQTVDVRLRIEDRPEGRVSGEPIVNC